MIEITSIKDGIVIDHIKAGLAMKIYELLDLSDIDSEVALIMNARSTSMGKKDIFIDFFARYIRLGVAHQKHICISAFKGCF